MENKFDLDLALIPKELKLLIKLISRKSIEHFKQRRFYQNRLESIY